MGIGSCATQRALHSEISHGFDPARDTVPFEEMEEIDRWALAELNRVTTEVLAAYEAFEFHNVYRALFNFATVTLSARYFDIIKDRLYTFAPRNKARRSAQTALLRIGDALARMLAPILVFTADEIWENLPNREEPSIHLALLPKADAQSHDALLAEWERLFAIRDDVLRALEEARVAKQIGSSLRSESDVEGVGKCAGVAAEASKRFALSVHRFAGGAWELDGRRRRFDNDLERRR